jgi:hypothetical protein
VTTSADAPDARPPAGWPGAARPAARRLAALWLVPLVAALHAVLLLGLWRDARTPEPEPAPPAQDSALPARQDIRLVAQRPARDDAAQAEAPAEPGAARAGIGKTASAAAPPADPSGLPSPDPVMPRPAPRPAAPPGQPALRAAAAEATGAAGAEAPTSGRGSSLAAAAMPAAGSGEPAMPMPTDTEPGPGEPGPATPAIATLSEPMAAVAMPVSYPSAPPGTAAPTARPGGAAPAAAWADGPSLPLYRGQVPPAATLHFSLRRAALSGRGQLEWRPGPEGYELMLQGSVLGVRALQQTSRGRWDLGSLAPERFLDTRRGRETRAANFRHDAGLISYSGPSITYPLVRGAQDRLSWMLHLPAVMEANPALRTVGTELRMFVSGARGDGDVWAFRVLSRDRISVPAGEVPQALHLQRLPRHEHDTQADIWLDPARHHLPVRVRLQSGEDVLELVLDRLDKG